MTLIQSRKPKSEARLSRFAAYLAAGMLVLGAAPIAWGQGATDSRWSTSNPPTPAMVHAPQKQAQDDGLRRLPPIDQEVTPNSKPTSVAATEKPGVKPEIAGKPQSTAGSAKEADPVDWSNPKVVIGPETSTRMVNHEEMVTTPMPQKSASRYSSAPEVSPKMAATQGKSRFTQKPAEAPKKEAKPAESKPAAPVFARVFDEETESPGITQPEVAAIDPSLSPIFACRLLGLPATKQDATTVR